MTNRKLNDLGNLSANMPEDLRKHFDKQLKYKTPTEIMFEYFDFANFVFDAKRMK